MPRPQSETDPYYIETDPQAGQKALKDAGSVAGMLNSVLTPMGDYEAYRDMQKAFKEGNYGEGLFHGATMIPAVGDVLKFAPAMLLGMRALKAPDSIELWDDMETLSNRELWDKHGWYKQDGRMKWEIDDSKASINTDVADNLPFYLGDTGGLPVPNTVTVKELFNHPELYDNYDLIGDINVVLDDNMGASAMLDLAESASVDGATIRINPDLVDIDNPEELKKNLLHELQHAVQTQEGWQNGARFSLFLSEADDLKIKEGMEQTYNALDSVMRDATNTRSYIEDPFTFGALSKVLNGEDAEAYLKSSNKLHEFGWDQDEIKRLAKNITFLGNKIKNSEMPEMIDQITNASNFTRIKTDEAWDKYLRVVGEAEARNVEIRMNFNDTQRKESFPLDTQDVQNTLNQRDLDRMRAQEVFGENPFNNPLMK